MWPTLSILMYEGTSYEGTYEVNLTVNLSLRYLEGMLVVAPNR